MIVVESHIGTPSGFVTTGMPPFHPASTAAGCSRKPGLQPPRAVGVVEVAGDLAGEVRPGESVDEIGRHPPILPHLTSRRDGRTLFDTESGRQDVNRRLPTVTPHPCPIPHPRSRSGSLWLCSAGWSELIGGEGGLCAERLGLGVGQAEHA